MQLTETLMVRGVAVGGKASTLGVSVVLHVAVFLAAGVHVRSTLARPVQPPIEIAIAIETAPEPEPPKEEPLSNQVTETPPVHAASAHSSPARTEAGHAIAATESKSEASPPADAPPTFTGDSLPHFAIATSTIGGRGQTLAKSAGTAPLESAGANEDEPYAEGSVDVPARAMRPVRPTYPLQARVSGIEGSVKLEIILSNTGVVESVRARSHLGSGLEEAAIAAARKTPFTPAMKRGRAVPVRMAWSIEFQLQ
jgi:periplasmic protein TonB